MSILQTSAVADLLLYFPGESLRSQLRCWNERHSAWQLEASFERSLSNIRGQLCSASAVLVDATEDPLLATDVFLQAVARLGVNAVIVYTERTNHDLELFIRIRGSLFLLGPVDARQWDDLLERRLLAKGEQTLAQLEQSLSSRRWDRPHCERSPANRIANAFHGRSQRPSNDFF